jgi:serine/threonine-protein kinase
MIGGYQITGELGEGQFGTVWRAVGEAPARGGMPGKRRYVAIKKVRDTADADLLRLLKQEFALLDQVKHRGIVRVYEYLDKERAVVMELVHGVPLRAVLEKCQQAGEPIPAGAALWIASEIADALYQAYTSPGDNGEQLQLVHRDLKPENIMLTPNGDLKILDFGLARVGNTEFAKDDPRLVKGTPVYMSPEQARGEEIDHRTDLFALGLILFELLTAQPAYRVDRNSSTPDTASLYKAIEQGDLAERLSENHSRLASVASVLSRLLHPRQSQRYQTGQDLLIDLRQVSRDSSSIFREFCSFYFSSIHRLEPLPELEAGAHTMSDNSSEPKNPESKSIADRLREKSTAPPTAPKITAVQRNRTAAVEPVAPPAGPPSAPPLAPPTAPKTAAVPPRIIPRTASAARPAPETEDILPSAKSSSKPDARGSDDPGLLSLKPLSSLKEAEESQDNQSATQFFAIPPPQAKAPKPAPPPDEPPAVQSQGPGPAPAMIGQGNAGQSFDRPAFGAPTPMGGIGMGGASGPTMTSAGTPFGVGGGVPTGNANKEKDFESSRVWVLVAGMFIMGCTLMVGLAALIIFIPKGTPEAVTPVPSTTVAPPPPDEEIIEIAPPPTTPTVRRTTTPGTPKTTAATPPPAASDKVSFNFSGDPKPAYMVLSCPSGYNQRSGGSFTGVPAGESCTLYPKGPSITASGFSGVKAGRSYSCSIAGGTTTTCK